MEISAANEEPGNDHSRHEPAIRTQLFLLQLSHRASHGLCIYCGEVKAMGACKPCKEARRQKRIAEAGYDYYEGLFNEE